MLFDKKPRTRMGPMLQGEGDFDFYDSCGRPGYDDYRNFINAWISEVPNQHRADIIARLKRNDPMQYRATLAELMVHATLLRQGYHVEIHPTAGHPTRKPDFLVRTSEGKKIAFIEVTTFGPTTEERSQSNREADIYNAIDCASLPEGFRLTYSVESHGAASPKLKKLRAEIEEWACECAKIERETRFDKIFIAEDWRIEIGLFGGLKISNDKRAIVASLGKARWIAADMEIRGALEKKSRRYGDMEIPYVIAVADCKGELTGGNSNDEELLEALYGSVAYTLSTDANHEVAVTSVGRQGNGFWGTPDNPRNSHVSGVLLIPNPDLWALRSPDWQPILARNHRGSFALSADLLPLQGYELTAENIFIRTIGAQLADFLEIPEVWPPPDT